MSDINKIMLDIANNGGRALFVGGYVRDYLLGRPCKDIDIEVYGLSSNKLIEILSKYGSVDPVGKSFGVIKCCGYDFSLPRRESKEGRGHKGFQVESDPNLSMYEASLRRDFTINSMMMDAEGKIIDYHGGQSDLYKKILRATSEHFVEDPLRVLRGFQFISRFGILHFDIKTIGMCKNLFLEYETLSKERIFEEWFKWTKGSYPSVGLRFLGRVGWIKLFPQIHLMENIEQDPEWHPEKNLLVHTYYVLDAMAEICNREGIEGEDRAILFFSALCHDMGKVTNTIYDGRIRSPGHDIAGVPLAKEFLESIGCYPRIIDNVLPLVREHMVHVYGEVNLRKLANRLYPANIKQLLYLMEADHSGRPPLPKGLPEQCKDWLERAREMEIEDSKPKPIVRGRDLLHLMDSGPEMGKTLKRLYELQLEGKFSTLEEGLKLL